MRDRGRSDMVAGVVTSRRSPVCGHHEVGYERADGTFIPLRPGDRIGVFPPPEAAPPEEGLSRHAGSQDPSHGPDINRWVPWAPEPILPSRSLCRRYGVLIGKESMGSKMTPALYETAYREKLERLMEKEGVVPLSTLLDRHFAAAYLASGTWKEAAAAVWEEIDKIREPVTRVREWLTDPGGASLLRMIHPYTKDQLGGPAPTQDQLREELAGLSLEDFLDTL